MPTPIEKLMGGVTERHNRLAATRLLGQLGEQDVRPESEMLQDPNFQELSLNFPQQADRFRNERQAIRESLKVQDAESERAFFEDMRNVMTRLEGGDLSGAKSVLLNRRIALNQIPGAVPDDVDRILGHLENEDFDAAMNDLITADQIAVRNQILPPLGQPIEDNRPSSVREFDFFQSLDPEDQEIFMRIKRGQDTIDLGDRTVVPSQSNPGQVVAEFPEGIPPEQQPENVRDRTTAQETAEQEVIKTFEAGQARNAADAVIANSDKLVNAVDNILNHPGLEAISGASALFDPRTVLPGADANDARVLLNQLKDVVFVDSLNAIRAASKTGGAVGSVSDAEGARLENMLGALSRFQSDEQLVEQLQKIREEAENLKNRTNEAFSRRYTP